MRLACPEDIFLGEPCARPEGKHVVRYYTCTSLHSTERRINSTANCAHPPGEHMKKLDCDFAVLADYK